MDGLDLGIGYFGDRRRAARGLQMLERASARESLRITDLSDTRAEEIGFHRFLDSPQVSWPEILETAGRRTGAACQGRRVLAIQDTTEINFAGRAAGRRGLGPAGDGESPGFFLHPTVAVDRDQATLLGVAGAHIWSRPARARESERWLDSLHTAAERLAEARSIVAVSDREGDIYRQFAHRPAEVDLVVRIAQDRKLVDGGGLYTAARAWPELDRIEAGVPAHRPADSARTATLAVRAGRVRLRRPRKAARGEPAEIGMTLVELAEVDPPEGRTPVIWRLLTTLPADTAAQAREVAEIYRLRWRIEQVFRALKRDGLGLDDVQMQARERLFKLAALGLVAAARTLQLVDARAGSDRPAADVLDPGLIDAVAAIGRTFEGATKPQQNPFEHGSLAWLSWIVARMGGWKGYYRSPGPKTMAKGWDRLAEQLNGYLKANP